MQQKKNCSEARGSGLLRAESLLTELWPDANSRPSLPWLRRQQAKNAIPHIRIGRLVYFDAAKVREALETRFTVRRGAA